MSIKYNMKKQNIKTLIMIILNIALNEANLIYYSSPHSFYTNKND